MATPILDNGFYDVPPGKLATVVTHLEMRSQAGERPARTPNGVTLERFHAPGAGWYRDLFTRVGGQGWLWFSRLKMDDDALSGILGDPGTEIWALLKDGQAEGLLELDFRQEGACELAFFGVTSSLIGTGAGRVLMNRAITRAWARPITRFHVHTCTLDHPAALSFYIRSGFRPVRQQIEVDDDPRLDGSLPRDAGPHVPVFRPVRG